MSRNYVYDKKDMYSFFFFSFTNVFFEHFINSSENHCTKEKLERWSDGEASKMCINWWKKRGIRKEIPCLVNGE